MRVDACVICVCSIVRAVMCGCLTCLTCSLQVHIVEFHPIDPRIMMTGGYDGRIVLWNTSTGERCAWFAVNPLTVGCTEITWLDWLCTCQAVPSSAFSS